MEISSFFFVATAVHLLGWGATAGVFSNFVAFIVYVLSCYLLLPLCTAATPAADVPPVQDAVDDVTTLEQAASSELPDVGATEVERSPTEDGTLCSLSRLYYAAFLMFD